ncbi:SMP-30/gluconolactonase/LRE family protein [Lichenihabitans sp. PAMC28606]|uniref:SMP-30/gluconolactonase/LRE family protein n=1 Tax=Lichenihabitans sp. PAMC28606 TaxID=2880932 RepID=UPI001D0B4245|nr:SMP-30/gluconolactonase/LRE family protein [Lichenihabitans sp. PAMC28606]UDL96213.1 SMP-30/gluconolactonase/LRE family protein [Lichenihabitans sp. PAMC28606]
MEQPFAVIDPRFKSFVLPNAPLLRIGEGFGWTEGPVWFGDQQCLLFSDVPNDRVMRWTPTGGVSVFRQPCGFENGHARDREGRLISCSHHDRCVRRTELDGSLTILADHYRGKRLNSPNDVAVMADGSVWFSDPPYGIQTDYEGGKQDPEVPPRLYRLDPSGDLDIAADDFDGPNGLCFSPDERRLYVTETGKQFDSDPVQHIRVFDVGADGRRLLNGRVFHTIHPGNADGIRCDSDGNLWSGAADGVHCLDPDGTLLGKILVPSLVSNLEFGGRNKSQLFLCAGQSLYTLAVNRRGARWP